MTVGLFVGAWAFSRHGWRGVWVVAITWTILSILDAIFGWQVGETLARATLALFGYEAGK